MNFLSQRLILNLSSVCMIKNSHSINVFQSRNIFIGNLLKHKMNPTGSYLTALRKLMRELPSNEGSIAAYIIPSDDAHQSEYICARDERRAFISGFDGSAGTAVVTLTKALLWTDGRYYQQAAKQLDENWTLMKDNLPGTPSIPNWLAKNLPTGSRVGVDSNLMAHRVWSPINSELEAASCSLISIENNLIDAIWEKQPFAPDNKVITFGTEFCGQTISEKLEKVRFDMADKDTDVLVLTALDEVAWFLNLRGSDIDYNPVFFSYVIITKTDLFFFVDETKLPSDIASHFDKNCVSVTIKKYENVKSTLSDLEKTAKKVWVSRSSSQALADLVPEKKRYQEITPIAILKAIKNNVEAEGMRNCHVRDGVALCQYFAWLENAIRNGEHVDEISGADKLESFRKTKENFMGLSFGTISGSGPNGSVIHYHPLPETNRPITDKEIYLCDSGAQYLDGTTDVTRTVHLGTPNAFEKECYTRVLKGQINLGTTIFPNKVKGQVLDTLARKALWDVGLDYGHGTGHGVGHFLNVHEGPMGIGIRLMPDDSGLQANMFVSNEPGYYEDGKFGIRIEDIVQIVPAQPEKSNFNGRGALTFYTVTMCPIQTKMIIPELLTDKERKSLNDYHKRVLDVLSPLLIKENDTFTLDWLKKETQAI